MDMSYGISYTRLMTNCQLFRKSLTKKIQGERERKERERERDGEKKELGRTRRKDDRYETG
jgi:hypothetical protein